VGVQLPPGAPGAWDTPSWEPASTQPGHGAPQPAPVETPGCGGSVWSGVARAMFVIALGYLVLLLLLGLVSHKYKAGAGGAPGTPRARCSGAASARVGRARVRAPGCAPRTRVRTPRGGGSVDQHRAVDCDCAVGRRLPCRRRDACSSGLNFLRVSRAGIGMGSPPEVNHILVTGNEHVRVMDWVAPDASTAIGAGPSSIKAFAPTNIQSSTKACAPTKARAPTKVRARPRRAHRPRSELDQGAPTKVRARPYIYIYVYR